MGIILDEDLTPKIRLAAFNKIPSLLFEHGVVVGDSNKLIVAKAFSIGNVGKVRIAGFTKLSDNEGLVKLHV